MKLLSLSFSNCYFFPLCCHCCVVLTESECVIECCGCPVMDQGAVLPASWQPTLWDKSRSKSPTLSWFLCSMFSSNLCFILAESAQSELLMWKMWVYFYLFRVLRVAVGLQGRCSAKLPTTPFQSFSSIYGRGFLPPAGCATLSAMQPDLFLSPALQRLGLLSLALPERKIFISPSSWSPVKTRFRSRPAIKTRTKGRVKAKDVFTLWSICSGTNRTGRCC